MIRNGAGRVLTAVVCVLAGSCGEQDLTGPSDQSCRTYATQFTRQITKPSFTTPPEVSTCRYDEGSSALTCEGPLTMFAGCTGRLTTRGTYRSTADFVSEAARAGRMLQMRDVETLVADCTQSGTATVDFSYDGQGRLTGRAATIPGASVGVTYTAWDGSGRPTRGTVTTPGAAPCALSIAYDDGARTMETTVTCTTQSTSSVERLTYDANGNTVRLQHAGSGREDSDERRTIDRTDRVCTSR
jgi:YD repeat-containing protein